MRLRVGRHGETKWPVFGHRGSALFQRLAPDQGPHHANDVAQLAERLAEGSAVETLDDFLAAGAQAEDEAALADLVEGGRAHGQKAGRAAEGVDDSGTQLDALGDQGQLGEKRKDLVAPGLGDPKGVIAELVGELRCLDVELAIVVLPEGDESGAFTHGRVLTRILAGSNAVF